MRRYIRLFSLCAVAAVLCLALLHASGSTPSVHAPKVLLSSSVNRGVPVLPPAAAAPQPKLEADFVALLNLAATLRANADIPEPHPAAPLVETGEDAPLLPEPEKPERTAPEKQPPEKPAGKYREVWAVVTAYCPCSRCCGKDAAGKTSVGSSAWRPGIAADPKAISYGTKVYVPGYGTFVVDDTGGAMRRSWRRDGRVHVDIRMTYHWQAKDWGHKLMKIRVYE